MKIGNVSASLEFEMLADLFEEFASPEDVSILQQLFHEHGGTIRGNYLILDWLRQWGADAVHPKD